MIRGLHILGGGILLVVGLLGLALPIMPGWIFLIPGLAILGREFVWARRATDWLKKIRPKQFGSKPRGKLDP